MALENACHQSINGASDRCNLLQDWRALLASFERAFKRIYLSTKAANASEDQFFLFR
jgi:hypothetical protein